MGQVQTFLVIGAAALFSILVLNANRLLLLSKEQEIKAEYVSISTYLAKSLVDEISSKSYDNNTIDNPELTDLSVLSSSPLGPENGETYPNFNDFDDFNNYSRTDTSSGRGSFDLKAKVDYIDEYSYDAVSNVKTRTKRLIVSVINLFMQDTVKIYYYKSY